MSQQKSQNKTLKPQLSENEVIALRRQRQEHFARTHTAYPNKVDVSHLAQQLQQNYTDTTTYSAEYFQQHPISVSVAGRVMAHRHMGKIGFARLEDQSGFIQIYASLNDLGDMTAYADLQVGDIISVTGHLYRTNTGELSVKASRIDLLNPTIRPLPGHHGLVDVEQRYRHREIDLIVNSDERQRFIQRSKMIQSIRQTLQQQDFLEVETPILHPIPGGATARPFATHHQALNAELYLRIAPELYLKRLVVGGLHRVYELGRNFRNEGLSTRHNPEFTMMEVYQAFSDSEGMMRLCQTLIQNASQALGVHEVNARVGEKNEEHAQIDLRQPFQRWRMDESLRLFVPTLEHVDLCDVGSWQEWEEQTSQPTRLSSGDTWEDKMVFYFETYVEPYLLSPTFITHHPARTSPLARVSDAEPQFAERFELYIGGREIANGYSELNDPALQLHRFEEQAAIHQASGSDEGMHVDHDYIRALETGLPPTGGLGIGIDRLAMVLTQAPSIRDVLLFPAMKPKV